MQKIINFLFNNIILLLILFIGGFIFFKYKKLKDKTNEIIYQFNSSLNEYLNNKIKNAKEKTNQILKEYGREDTVSTEISRLLIMIEKGEDGTINDKVKASNAINKFKINKNIDLDRYPMLKELNNIGTFTVEELESVDNGLSLSRTSYNALAFQYNEEASSFPMQYITKYLGLNSYFEIFDAPKKTYSEVYEVFEEQEEEINTLECLNVNTENRIDLPKEKKVEVTEEDLPELVLKPTVEIEELTMEEAEKN